MKTQAQLRADLLGLFERADAIERKYSDGLITDTADQETMTSLMGEIKTAEGLLAQITDAEARQQMIRDGVTRYGTAQKSAGSVSAPVPTGQMETKTLGDMFVESDEYRSAQSKGLFDSAKGVPSFAFSLDGFSLIEHKNLIYSGSGSPGMGIGVSEPFESRSIRPGYLPLLYAPHTFLSLVSRVPTDEELIEWVKESSFTNNAAFVAEATATTGTSGTKPESTMAFTIATTAVKDIAHWMAVTNKMLRNTAAVRGLINQRLVFGLDAKLENEIVNGDGTDLYGILSAGIQTQALGSDSVMDAIHKALTKVRVTGLAVPNVIIMHPNDWQDIRLSRTLGDTGDYLLGPPIMAGIQTLWGIPVTLTQSITEGTVLVGDMNQVTLFDRMRTVIRTGLIDDQMIRNMQTILAEMAVALVVWRPSAFCMITGA